VRVRSVSVRIQVGVEYERVATSIHQPLHSLLQGTRTHTHTHTHPHAPARVTRPRARCLLRNRRTQPWSRAQTYRPTASYYTRARSYYYYCRLYTDAPVRAKRALGENRLRDRLSLCVCGWLAVTMFVCVRCQLAGHGEKGRKGLSATLPCV